MIIQRTPMKACNKTCLLSLTLAFSVQVSQAQTSMDTLAKEYPNTQCQKALVQVANQEIRNLPHRLHSIHKNYKTDEKGVAIAPFSAFGVVEYNDRPMLVNFIASPVTSTRCDIQLTKQYVVDNPCVGLREETFKKWTFQGKLNDDVFVVKSKKRDNETAYLSPHFRARQCHVLIQQSYQ